MTSCPLLNLPNVDFFTASYSATPADFISSSDVNENISSGAGGILIVSVPAAGDLPGGGGGPPIMGGGGGGPPGLDRVEGGLVRVEDGGGGEDEVVGGTIGGGGGGPPGLGRVDVVAGGAGVSNSDPRIAR